MKREPFARATRAVRAVVLDYGGVLSLPQDHACVQQMADHLGVSLACLHRAYRQERPAYDLGHLSGEAYWQRVAAGCHVEPSGLDLSYLIAQDVQSWTQLNQGMVQFLTEVRKRVGRLAMISNMTENTLIHMRSHFTWLGLMDECVFSCEIGVIKPGRAIYEYCLDRLGRRADECVFVDDSAQNVRGARDVGMVGIRYESEAQFLTELGRYNLIR